MKKIFDMNKNILLLLTVLYLGLLDISFALAPPGRGEIEEFKKDGTFEKRLEFANRLGNDKVSPDLIQRKSKECEALSKGEKFDVKSFPYKTGLPSQGSPKIFVLLIDFSDYPHTQTQTSISEKLFNEGDKENFPYDSLKNFYYRSSYQSLTITGDAIGWYRAAHARSYYYKQKGDFELITEALDYYNSQGYDFSKYDNNNDGKIDYFAVIWTGPHFGWSSFWWAWCSSIDPAETYTVDSKKLGVFSWQWELKYAQNETPSGSFSPMTIIHETGHALGLPDLYDYYNSLYIGPFGGVGGLDIMDGFGDHNGYSKWLLNWLTPTVVSASNILTTINLSPAANYGDCTAIMPGMSVTKPFSEFFLVQNRTKTGNDIQMPTSGILIFHVDATLNDAKDGFKYSNSWTEHKFMRLMEADGLEQIEQGKSADAGDFYTNGKILTPYSSPNSNNYQGQSTGVSVGNISNYLFYIKADFLISSSSSYLWDAVDNYSLLWQTSGNSVWIRNTSEYFYDGDSARNIVIGDNQSSLIESRATGPGMLSFFWKVNSEENGDFLQFYVDGNLKDQISGDIDWNQKTYYLSYGSHQLTWKYIKNGSVKFGMDCGWIDKVEFSQTLDVAEALDNTSFEWKRTGNALWFGENAIYYFGGDAAQSGVIANNKSSILSAESNTAGMLKFAWKVSSEEGSDFLEFYIDDVLQEKISGEVDWSIKTFSIPSGTHSLKWQYKKDGSGSAGMDCGWIDKVDLGDASLAEGLDNSDISWITYGENIWKKETNVYFFDGDAVQSPTTYIGTNKLSYLEGSVTGPGVLEFYWKEDSTSSIGDLNFKIDGIYKTGIWNKDWSFYSADIPAGLHKIQWEYDLYSSGVDFGFVDKVVFKRTIDLAEALDQPNFTYLTGGNTSQNLWTGQNQTCYFGEDAAQSGYAGNNQWSWLEANFSGSGTVKFAWKVSSQINSDYLEFYIDDVFKEKISGNVDWQEKNYSILEQGVHTLKWIYQKDGSGASGGDCGWVDKLQIDNYLMPLSQAVDNTSLLWDTAGYANWFGETNVFSYGGSAAQSGAISHNQYSRIFTTIQGPGILSFDWKTSSQTFDYLEFVVDGATRDKISGNTDWLSKQFLVPEGSHSFSWRYIKDSSFSDYMDCGWLDKVKFEPMPSNAEAVDYTDFTWTTGGDALWSGENFMYYFDNDAAMSGAISDGQKSTLSTIAEGPCNISFYWKTSSEEDADYLKFYIDGVETDKLSGDVDWSQKFYQISTAGNHELKWEYEKNASGAAGDDYGALDRFEYAKDPGAYVIYVPQTYSTIQEAINKANEGCEIIVSPARYAYGKINFGGKNVIVRSTNPYDYQTIKNTKIDGGQSGSAVTFEGSETASCKLMGFTIQNGKLIGDGGGISGNRTKATIQNNIIMNNSATNGGGLAWCSGITQNNFILKNAANIGGGLYKCGGRIQSNTIYANSAVTQGLAVAECVVVIKNSIIWEPGKFSISLIYNSSTPEYCCIRAWTGGGTGNFTTSPGFIDETNLNLHIKPNSSCVDSGGYIGLADADVDGNIKPTIETNAPRGDGTHFDVGADESSARQKILEHILGKNIIPLSELPTLDGNGDSMIDISDLLLIMR